VLERENVERSVSVHHIPESFILLSYKDLSAWRTWYV